MVFAARNGDAVTGARRYRNGSLKTSPRVLKQLAGVIWLLVGVMLLVRSGPMLVEAHRDSGLGWTIFAAITGLLLGGVKGRYVLWKTARQNRRRLETLSSAPVWQVFTGKTWLLVVGMVGLGLALRAGASAGWYPWAPVAGLYAGIGAALGVSSMAYFVTVPPTLVTRVEQLPKSQPRPRGLLVVNLGTPDEPTTAAVRRYLKQFLGDRRVVEAPRWLWFFVLRCIILPLRGPRSAAAYQRVWGPDGSPLFKYSKATTKALAERLGEPWHVELAMRYGNPSLTAGLDRLRENGCEQVVVLPLFPQSSNTTTGTVQAEVARIVERRRDPPALQFADPFYDDAGYIEALVARVHEAAGAEPVDFYVFSFHGLPESYVRMGDPYLCQCTVTAFELARALGLQRHQWEMVFQSRFGDEPWLQPFADHFVRALADQHKRVLVTMPGFAADCLETLEEIGMEMAEDFKEAGGHELVVVPALNDHPVWVEALAQRVSSLMTAPLS